MYAWSRCPFAAFFGGTWYLMAALGACHLAWLLALVAFRRRVRGGATYELTREAYWVWPVSVGLALGVAHTWVWTLAFCPGRLLAVFRILLVGGYLSVVSFHWWRVGYVVMLMLPYSLAGTDADVEQHLARIEANWSFRSRRIWAVGCACGFGVMACVGAILYGRYSVW